MGKGRPGAAMLAALGFLLSANLGATSTAALAVGEPAPPFSLPDLQGKTRRFDKASTGTALLVFVKPDDRHSAEALAALNRLLLEPDLTPKGGLKRYVILSRQKSAEQAKPLAAAAGPKWQALLDRDDQTYRQYKIIATPTVVLVGPDHAVAAVNPGYDPAMTARIRDGLLALLGPSRPRSVVPPAPYMPLQIGRQLAARKLWDNALKYYLQAESEGRLPPEGRLEMAGIYLEMGDLAKAKETLDSVPPAPALAQRRDLLRKRILKAEREIGARKTVGK